MTCTFNGFLKMDIIKCVMEIKQGVWWAQSSESMDLVAILYKVQKRHASTCITLEAIGQEHTLTDF